MLRRYLVDDGFLERCPDGSRYWVKNAAGEPASRGSEV